MKNLKIEPITTYSTDFKKEEVYYKVNIFCYSEPIIDTISNGPFQTAVQISSSNDDNKPILIYLPNYLDNAEAEKIFAEIETKINDLL